MDIFHSGVVLTTDKSRGRRKRAKYSRDGCLQCKKMKLKCDEMKPSCSRCSRTYKECTYKNTARLNPPNINASFQTSSTTAAIETAKLTSNVLELIEHDLSNKMHQAISLDEALKPSVASPYEDPDFASRIDYDLLQTYGCNNDMRQTKNSVLHSTSIFHFPFECFLSLKDESHKRYFETFFREFSEFLMPLKSSKKSNTIRDILIQNALKKDYLYFAILASGARFLYRKTLFEEDQKYCARFMIKTLEMLNDFTFIQSFCKNPHEKMNNDIISYTLEPLLLTILLLTSDNASSMKDNWRNHLKGAKELLKKIFIDEIFPKTNILIFCKCWFTLFEVLAGMTAPYGGTLVKKDEIEKLTLNINDEHEMEVLTELQIVRNDGFNFVLGFHNSLLPPLIKIIERIRNGSDRSSRSLGDSEFVFSLISNLNQCKLYEIRESETEFSWNEAIYHAHIQAALLTIMTKFLDVPSTNMVVQELTDSILNICNSGLTTALDETRSTRAKYPEFGLMMAQWPLLTAGVNSVTDDQQYQVETMFRFLAEWGSGSAKYAFNKIQRAWNKNEQTNDMLEVDIVTY